jgi:serine/threonine protein kinase/Tol biopolymer transport system component
VKALFQATVDRPTEERDAFLAALTGDDDALRREVESLLTSDASDVSFLDLLPFASEPVLADPLAAPLASMDHTRSLAVLIPGLRVGPYQIVAPLGAGAMGEVYRACDTKLNREVALKVLPERFALDPDRLARFKREAQLLATLNHPNIAAIYGLEESNGVQALVLELVDGPTLADRIALGPMSLEEALTIARQLAEALEAAHEKGIIHRDLKPANIKIARNGGVKVLDFGLAKVWDGAPQSDLSRSPRLTAIDTGERTILGSPAYMSPEQARGQPLDRRTDIWSFGCVLYEMLTARAAFARDTITDTLTAVVEREPDWQALPAATPPSVRRLLQRCLDKDATRRLHDIGDARVDLDDALEARRASGRPAYLAVGLIVVTLLLLAGGVGLFYSAKPSAPVTSPSEYTQITNFTDSAAAPSLSPDGRMVTFIRGGEFFFSSGEIYVKLLPNGESVRLTNDARRKYAPVFTPDGSRIAFTLVTPGSWDTWTVPVLGGQPARLLPNASGLTWVTDQRILFSEIMAGTVFHMGIVTATEGRAESREIYFPPHESGMAHYSYASPDRKSVLAVEMTRSHTFDVPCRLLPFDGSSAGRQVGPPGTCTSTAWSPDGRWMYFGARVGGSAHLWRQKFPDGTPEQITFGPTEEEGIALAPDGRSLITSVGNRRSVIWIHDATGDRAISSEGYALSPRLSRDGTRVFYLSARDVVSSRGDWVPSSAELRSVDLASGKTDSVLSGVSVTDYDMSRDEKEVAFTTTDSGGASQIWLAPLDRRTPPLRIAAGDQVSFGAEGDLVFRSLEGTTNFPVRIKKDGSGRERLTSAPILEKFGVSPDGAWVTALTAPGELSLVPLNGGVPKKICAPPCGAAWSADGKFLYVEIDRGTSAASPGKTLAIPVPAGKSFPDLPASGIDSVAAGSELPGARVIEHGSLSPGPDPSTYVFTKTEQRRNLFRIPLH